MHNMYTYAERQSYGKMNVLLAMKKRHNSLIESAVLRSTTTMSNRWLLKMQTWPCSIRCKRSRALQHLAASTTAVLYRTLLHEAFFALGAFIALEAFIARFGASSRALQHLAKSSFIAFLAFLSPA